MGDISEVGEKRELRGIEVLKTNMSNAEINQRKYMSHKTGVINDPLGQSADPAGSDCR